MFKELEKLKEQINLINYQKITSTTVRISDLIKTEKFFLPRKKY